MKKNIVVAVLSVAFLAFCHFAYTTVDASVTRKLQNKVSELQKELTAAQKKLAEQKPPAEPTIPAEASE